MSREVIEALFGRRPEDLVDRILSDFTRVAGRFATAEDLEELARALDAVAGRLRELARSREAVLRSAGLGEESRDG